MSEQAIVILAASGLLLIILTFVLLALIIRDKRRERRFIEQLTSEVQDANRILAERIQAEQKRTDEALKQLYETGRVAGLHNISSSSSLGSPEECLAVCRSGQVHAAWLLKALAYWLGVVDGMSARIKELEEKLKAGGGDGQS